jgi:hypothetical protein
MSSAMTFDVEVVLKGRSAAVTESATVLCGDEPASWNDEAVRDVLMEILRAIDRADDPAAAGDRRVRLHGFSWIVEPATDGESGVVIAIEIPMGAAVAGPFAVDGRELDAIITRVLKAERGPTTSTTVH